MEVLAPPPTDPLVRKEPPFDWYRTPDETRPRVETASSLPDLDPDVALWPVTPVNRWPFTGAPTEGIYPLGWIGVDNTGTAYVCTVGGEPGTWAAVGSGGGGGWPTVNGTGSGNLTAQTLIADTVGYNLTDLGTGGITLTTNNATSAGITFSDTGGGIFLKSVSGQGISISDNTAHGVSLFANGVSHITLETTGTGATTGITIQTQATDTAGITVTGSTPSGAALPGTTITGTGDKGLNLVGTASAGNGLAGVFIHGTGDEGVTIRSTGSTFVLSQGLMSFASQGGITFIEQQTSGITFQTNGGFASTGITLTTQATDATGIVLTDNSSHGVHVNGSGSGGIFLTTANAIHIDGGFLGFFSHTAFLQQTVTGALSTVADPSAKAVLTSILAALATSYGLVVDGTT